MLLAFILGFIISVKNNWIRRTQMKYSQCVCQWQYCDSLNSATLHGSIWIRYSFISSSVVELCIRAIRIGEYPVDSGNQISLNASLSNLALMEQ